MQGPTQYTVEASSVLINPKLTGTGRLLYYRRFAAMAADGDSNWLLVNLPSLYLHGVLAEIYRHIGAAEPAAISGNHYAAAAEAANRHQIEARHLNGPLSPRKRWA
jgi:hypothetical protein